MNEKERTFNKHYIKYGGIFLDNHSEKGKEILKQTKQIADTVNNYYKDKKKYIYNSRWFRRKNVKEY